MDECALLNLHPDPKPLIENLEAGLTLDEFLDNFPTVSRDQAFQLLEHWKRTLRRLAEPS